MPRLGKRPQKNELPDYELAAPVRKEFAAMHKLIDDAESFLDENQPILCHDTLNVLIDHIYRVREKYEPKEKKDETSS